MEEFHMSLSYVLDVQPCECSFDYSYKGNIYIITFRDDGVFIKKKGSDD